MNKLQHLKKIKYILLPILIFILLYRQGPIWLNNLQTRGEVIDQVEVSYLINSDSETFERFLFPDKDKKTILIVWVSWCPACHVEMKRFQSAIESEKIDASAIYAINPFEPQTDARNFLSNNNYDFVFINDYAQIAQQLDIQATPTIIHLDGNKVRYMATGISPTAIWRAQSFLGN